MIGGVGGITRFVYTYLLTSIDCREGEGRPLSFYTSHQDLFSVQPPQDHHLYGHSVLSKHYSLYLVEIYINITSPFSKCARPCSVRQIVEDPRQTWDMFLSIHWSHRSRFLVGALWGWALFTAVYSQSNLQHININIWGQTPEVRVGPSTLRHYSAVFGHSRFSASK